MKRNIKESRIIYFSSRTNRIGFDYTLCESSITRAGCNMDQGVFTHTHTHTNTHKFHFHRQVANIFSQAFTLLGLIRSVNVCCCSTPHKLLSLFCIAVRPKLGHKLLLHGISFTYSDVCKLDSIQRQFVCFSQHSNDAGTNITPTVI